MSGIRTPAIELSSSLKAPPQSIVTARSITFILVITLFVLEVLSGPIRSVFGAVGIYPLVYIPRVLMFLAVPLFLLMGKRFSLMIIPVITIIGLYLLLGAIKLPSLLQPAFAFWIMGPLLFGAVAGKHVCANSKDYLRVFLLLFGTVAGGVFLNYFIDFPWAGQAIDIAGKSVATSREWTAGGFSRISGFSRTSFDAAGQLLALAIFINAFELKKLFKFLVWVTAGIAIILTTTKGATFSYILLSLYSISNTLFNGNSKRRSQAFNYLWLFITLALMVAEISIPLSTLYMNYSLNLSSPFMRLLFESLGDRLDYTWPVAFSHLTGNFAWLFGNGLGSMGAAQSYFDIANYNSGDNLFVYVVVQYGLVLTLSFYAYLLIKMFKINRGRSDSYISRVSFPILIFLVSYGLVIGLIEGPILAFLLGLFMAGDERSVE